jgi:putative transposase
LFNGVYKESIYKVAGVSRQAYHQQILQHGKIKKREDAIIDKVIKFRKRHSKMGCRVLFYALKIADIGINKFEELLSSKGLGAKQKRKRIVTTTGVYDDTDENLINGIEINNVNAVIAGDITYFKIGTKLFYIFTLKDVYSKMIVGLYGSDNMMAINAVKTLRQVIYLRKKVNLYNTIHHSDAGSQYKSNIYKRLLNNSKIKMSIAENCLQNGMAEQFNDIVKNYYLINENLKTVKQLNKALQKIKKLINEERPVAALGFKTPVAFEQWIAKLPAEQRPKIKLYDFNKTN